MTVDKMTKHRITIDKMTKHRIIGDKMSVDKMIVDKMMIDIMTFYGISFISFNDFVFRAKVNASHLTNSVINHYYD